MCMATKSSKTDMSVGLGLLFSILALATAGLTTVYGYDYAVQHAAGEAARTIQINGGIAFGAAMLTAAIAIVAIHVYAD